MSKITYQECYRRLFDEVAGIVFVKANGELRVMLATKNKEIARLVSGADNVDFTYELMKLDRKCNINTGNMSVIDIQLTEGRCFKVERLVDIHFYGTPTTEEEADRIYADFKGFETEYTKHKNQTEDIDSL